MTKRERVITYVLVFLVGVGITWAISSARYTDRTDTSVNAVLVGNAKTSLADVSCGVNLEGNAFAAGQVELKNVGVIKIAVSFEFGKNLGYPYFTYFDTSDANAPAEFSLFNPNMESGIDGMTGRYATDCRVSIDSNYTASK